METMIMAPRRAYTQPQVGQLASARIRKVLGGTSLNVTPITLVAADVALNAQVAVLRAPKDFVVTSMNAIFGACDSGATLTMSIGDAASNARFAAASTTPRAGGTVTLVGTANLYQFPDDTDVLLTTTAAAAGLGATPTISLQMEGYIGP
jgi:hypothetical protein